MTFYIGGTATYTGAKYRVEFIHLNKATEFGRQKLGKVTGIKGQTICLVVSEEVVANGIVFCSDLDNFNKETGRLKALKIALRNPRIPTAHRRLLLDAYHNRPRNAAPEVRAVTVREEQ